MLHQLSLARDPTHQLTPDQAHLMLTLNPSAQSLANLASGNRLSRGAAGGSIGDGQQFYHGANNNGLHGGLLPHHLFGGIDNLSDTGMDGLENDVNLSNQRLSQSKGVSLRDYMQC